MKIKWTDCSFFTLHGFSHTNRERAAQRDTQKAMGIRHRACWWPVSARSALHGVRSVGGTFLVCASQETRAFRARTGSFEQIFSGCGGTPPASGWGWRLLSPAFVFIEFQIVSLVLCLCNLYLLTFSPRIP